jgi:hypothetical protein
MKPGTRVLLVEGDRSIADFVEPQLANGSDLRFRARLSEGRTPRLELTRV